MSTAHPSIPFRANIRKTTFRPAFPPLMRLQRWVRGQKLPIFSGYGMKHNELAAQIARQATLSDGGDFAIVFAAMGVKNDVAQYFCKAFEDANTGAAWSCS